ncbi:hypothetical protein Dimus_025076 [Dionaea muscipula]
MGRTRVTPDRICRRDRAARGRTSSARLATEPPRRVTDRPGGPGTDRRPTERSRDRSPSRPTALRPVAVHDRATIRGSAFPPRLRLHGHAWPSCVPNADHLFLLHDRSSLFMLELLHIDTNGDQATLRDPPTTTRRPAWLCTAFRGESRGPVLRGVYSMSVSETGHAFLPDDWS